MPPVTSPPTEIHHPGKFVWYDLLTDKVPEVKKFYGELFGWEYEGEAKANAPYTLIKYQGKPIGGIIYTDLKKELNESQWISYLSVPDVDQAFKFTGSEGGIQYRQPWELADRGRVAVVADPQGALFVLFRAKGGDPADRQPEMNEWLWTELLTTDPQAAVDFYDELVGFEHETTEITENHQYYVLKKDTRPRAGVVKNPWETIPPNWLPYVRVEDPAKLVEKVESLGGKVILAPREDIRKGSVALIADPSGAAVALQRWPME
ncbi:MAG: VOC family protein [Bacteroidales bacterium]|nr:VOC family protein [Bacteroidales bacterium]